MSKYERVDTIADDFTMWHSESSLSHSTGATHRVHFHSLPLHFLSFFWGYLGGSDGEIIVSHTFEDDLKRMTSYFPFSTSATHQAANSPSDDAHLEVTVTPSASAFYAGETFSVTITFRNTRPPPFNAAPPSTPRSAPQEVLRRRNQIGLDLISRPRNADAGPSKPSTGFTLSPALVPPEPGYPYSPGANPAYRAPGLTTSPEREEISNVRSPDAWKAKEYGALGKNSGHARRSQSLALGKGGMSPQEMVWALSGHSSTRSSSLSAVGSADVVLSCSTFTGPSPARVTDPSHSSPLPKDLHH